MFGTDSASTILNKEEIHDIFRISLSRISKGLFFYYSSLEWTFEYNFPRKYYLQYLIWIFAYPYKQRSGVILRPPIAIMGDKKGG